MASPVVAAAALQAHRAALLRLVPAPARAGPSLAQRLGLVAAPPPPLSPTDWLEVHWRSRERQDSSGCCPICLRAFRAEPQVLLSCTHCFHAHCLGSLERFSRQRCCPLCRCEAYESRRIRDAEELWVHTCSTRIQAAWRGALARRQAAELRRAMPPQHPVLRRRWCAERLGERAAPLVGSVERGSAAIDALFAQLDASRAAAAAVFGALERRCPGAGVPAARDAAPAMAEVASGSGGGGGVPAQPDCSQHTPLSQSACDWAPMLDRWLLRDAQPECSICLAPMALPRGLKGPSGGRSVGNGIALLSCTHAFHTNCLSAFEAFALASEARPTCPCCRAACARLDLR